MALFRRVTIVGLGLIGGSVGMAIRRAKLAHEVVGLSRSASVIRQARRLGAIDRGTLEAAEAVAASDLVILATPVDAIVPTAIRLARLMPPAAILTDVGSTKAQIVRRLDTALAGRVRFVGSHPLAGSECRGIEAAQAGLLAHAACIVTPTSRTDRHALAQVTRLWNRLGMRVVSMDPARHDAVLGAVSHVPHLLAFALTASTSRRALAVAPRSFLDATRVAQSDPDLWDDILLSNRAAVRASLRRVVHALGRYDHALRRNDRHTLIRLLRHAQSIRRRLSD